MLTIHNRLRFVLFYFTSLCTIFQAVRQTNRQPKTDNQQPTTNNQKPTTNNHFIYWTKSPIYRQKIVKIRWLSICHNAIIIRLFLTKCNLCFYNFIVPFWRKKSDGRVGNMWLKGDILVKKARKHGFFNEKSAFSFWKTCVFAS